MLLWNIKIFVKNIILLSLSHKRANWQAQSLTSYELGWFSVNSERFPVHSRQRQPMTTRTVFWRDILIVHGCETNAFYWTLSLYTFAANNHSSHRGAPVWHHKLACKELWRCVRLGYRPLVAEALVFFTALHTYLIFNNVYKWLNVLKEDGNGYSCFVKYKQTLNLKNIHHSHTRLLSFSQSLYNTDKLVLLCILCCLLVHTYYASGVVTLHFPHTFVYLHTSEDYSRSSQNHLKQVLNVLKYNVQSSRMFLKWRL